MNAKLLSRITVAALIPVTVPICSCEKPGPAFNTQASVAWSTLRGTIVWKGDKVPAPEQIKVNIDRECCLKNGPLASEEWVINPKNRGVQCVFIWLEPDPAKQPSKLPLHESLRVPKEKEITIVEKGCRLVPHVAAMREGQVLVVKNLDEAAHNFHWNGDPKFNPMYGKVLLPGPEVVIRDLRPQPTPISLCCNIHPWMQGWLMVFAHPYFAITEEDGRFAIPLAPVGQWRLKIWHEGTGWRGGAKGKDGEIITIRPEPITEAGELALNP